MLVSCAKHDKKLDSIPRVYIDFPDDDFDLDDIPEAEDIDADDTGIDNRM